MIEVARVKSVRTINRTSVQHEQTTHQKEWTELITEATFINDAYVLIPTCTQYTYKFGVTTKLTYTKY